VVSVLKIERALLSRSERRLWLPPKGGTANTQRKKCQPLRERSATLDRLSQNVCLWIYRRLL